LSCAGHKITAHRGGGRSARPLLLKEPSPWVKKPELEKQTSKILPITAEMRAAYEKHDKEWQESKYAKNMPLANARIFSRMSDEEKAELPESIHNYLFMYYEQNKERIKQDEEEQNTRDILGYIPGIGSVAEGISAYHAFEKGSIGEGFLYAVGSVPVGKYAVKGGKVALKSFRKVPRSLFKAGKVARNAKRNKFPNNYPQLKHIFRNKVGHLSDTPANRKLIENTANSKSNYLGSDKYGNDWFAKSQPDGTQVWVETRNGNIIDGGLNKTPKTYNPDTGLKSPTGKIR